MINKIKEKAKSFISEYGVWFFFAMCIFPLFMGQHIVGFIQNNLLKDPNAILIITEYYSAMFAGSLLSFDFLIGLWIAFNLITMKQMKKITKKSKKYNIYLSNRKQVYILLVILLIIILVQTAFVNNYSEIFKDRISYHNGFLLKRNDYRFKDIKGITIGYFRGQYAEHACYELLMGDGIEINIASQGIYPELFYHIDRIVPDSAIRKCEPNGINYVIDNMPEVHQEYYRKKYKL